MFIQQSKFNIHQLKPVTNNNKKTPTRKRKRSLARNLQISGIGIKGAFVTFHLKKNGTTTVRFF